MLINRHWCSERQPWAIIGVNQVPRLHDTTEKPDLRVHNVDTSPNIKPTPLPLNHGSPSTIIFLIGLLLKTITQKYHAYQTITRLFICAALHASWLKMKELIKLKEKKVEKDLDSVET